MMGSTRPSDPTLVAAGELVSLLKGLQESGVKDVLEKIDDAKAKAVATINGANKALQAKAKELSQKQSEIDALLAKHEQFQNGITAAQEELQKLSAETGAKASAVEYAQLQIEAAKADLAAQKDQLETDRQKLEEKYVLWSNTLTGEHNQRTAALDQREKDLRAEIEAVKHDLSERRRLHAEIDEGLKQRETDVSADEAAVENERAKLAKLQTQLEAKMATIKALAAG